jgi:hypothetical protein
MFDCHTGSLVSEPTDFLLEVCLEVTTVGFLMVNIIDDTCIALVP